MPSIITKKSRLFVFFLSATLVATILTGFVARAGAHGKTRLGNHSLQGAYMFHADGVVENETGGYIRGMWELGRFEADGNGNIVNGVEYSSLLTSSNPAVCDQAFSFAGTYEIQPDGTAKAHVKVIVNPQLSIE